MINNGLTKLMEECGELVQAAAKLATYPQGDHPDGGPPLASRIEEEMGDVFAACAFVVQKFHLDKDRIDARTRLKFDLLVKWDAE